MDFNKIKKEYDLRGYISEDSTKQLALILNSDQDPYRAINLAADCAAFSLAPKIAEYIESDDPMVRWSVIGTLLTRFRLKKYVKLGIECIRKDEDDMVKGISLCGVGEVLSDIEEAIESKEIASLLDSFFKLEKGDINPTLRDSAYEGILAAMSVPLQERPAANRLLKPEDIDHDLIKRFRAKYGLNKEL